jgi:hypothetical protein
MPYSHALDVKVLITFLPFLYGRFFNDRFDEWNSLTSLNSLFEAEQKSGTTAGYDRLD